MTHIPSSYLVVCLFVCGSALLAVAGLLLVRKVISFDKLVDSHEVGGYLLAVVGTLYAVLLGLIVVDAMQQYQAAREVTGKEANNLVDLYILAKQLPAPEGPQVRQMCKDYAKRVVDVEWQLMQDGSYCPVARSMAVDLMAKLMDFEPNTANEKALYPLMVQEAAQFWQNRQTRVIMATKGIPAAEWITLVIGAAIVVFFTYFFGMANLKLQMAMTAMVAVLIALNMSLLLLFAYPFSGDMSVQDESFKSVESIFQDH